MATTNANDLESGVLTQPSNTRFTHATILTKKFDVAPRPGMMTPPHGSDIGQALNLPSLRFNLSLSPPLHQH